MSNQLTLWLLEAWEKHAQRESLRYAGDGIVEHTRWAKKLSLGVTVLLFITVVVCIVMALLAKLMLTAVGFGGLFLLPLILTLDAYRTRITYDESGIHTRSAWRFSRFIPYSDIESCDYSPVNRWYRIRTRNHGIIRLSIYLRGVAYLLKILPCTHPGYPPAGNWGSSQTAQILPATMPAKRMKATGAKVVAALIFMIGLYLCVRWSLYRIPERSQHTEINGEVIEISKQPTGEKDVLLKVRMTHAPALLTWSTADGKGAWLQGILWEIHPGDPITVLVPTQELANPAKAMPASEPQIWLAALRAGRKEYLTFENHVLWNQEKRNGNLLVGMGFMILGAAIFWEALRNERRLNAAVSQS